MCSWKLVLFLLLAGILCSACGGSRIQYKSVQDAECYVKEQPAGKIPVQYGIRGPYEPYHSFLKRKPSFPWGLLSFFIESIDFTPSMEESTVIRASSFVLFFKQGIIYRKGGDGSEWDVFTEAVRRAGPRPTNKTCDVIIYYTPHPLSLSSYEGDDGEVWTNRSVGINFTLKRTLDEEPACDAESAEEYVNYFRKLNDKIVEIMKEQFAQEIPSYCIDKGYGHGTKEKP